MGGPSPWPSPTRCAWRSGSDGRGKGDLGRIDPMARNRKYQSVAIRFGPALKAFLLCLLLGGSGIGYVWQKNQIYQLGQQIKKREVRIAELEEQNEKLKRQLGTMRKPKFLER